ncbi:ribbon-helix-helix protein [Aestuariispira insulae]|uniref:Ribbon-helix-helix protein n=2 Tax=Aestuariispira insulae TaxID=1461337 RepID=A0A3D9HJN1_9PROT|nr:ribbon-helix-helix domain-containing protein [Aestuariispira insulae]RED49700.1 ribbon-helix-helix protein [Aestuariispira insulae]
MGVVTANDKYDPSEIKKRSVVIAGHRTSISLENIFWDSLRSIATSKKVSVNQVVTDIDRKRTGNLSSAIRTFVLQNIVVS